MSSREHKVIRLFFLVFFTCVDDIALDITLDITIYNYFINLLNCLLKYSYYNENEVDHVLEYVQELNAKLKISNKNINQSDIGILTPYNEQCYRIRQDLSSYGYDKITVGSAEIFQGQQRPVIIVSTVRTGENIGFVADPQRFNVMMTRAESLLIIIGHHQSLYSNDNWKKQIDHCISLNSLIRNGRKLHTRVQAP